MFKPYIDLLLSTFSKLKYFIILILLLIISFLCFNFFKNYESYKTNSEVYAEVNKKLNTQLELSNSNLNINSNSVAQSMEILENKKELQDRIDNILTSYFNQDNVSDTIVLKSTPIAENPVKSKKTSNINEPIIHKKPIPKVSNPEIIDEKDTNVVKNVKLEYKETKILVLTKLSEEFNKELSSLPEINDI